MYTVTGLGGSPGYASGTAVIKRSDDIRPLPLPVDDIAVQITRFKHAQDKYETRLVALHKETAAALGREAAEIFTAYRMILRDEVFFKKALTRLERERVSLEYLINDECSNIVSVFENMDNLYLQERAADIKNVCGELIRIMLGAERDFADVFASAGEAIVVAEDLTPAETVGMDKSRLRGFVTARGGITSHTVILAKALGVPAIVGARDALAVIEENDFLLLDAFSGKVLVNPNSRSKASFARLLSGHEQKRRLYDDAATGPAVTQDGHTVSVEINAGDIQSFKGIDLAKCDGVGLFRTEYLYMGHEACPDEECQFEAYRGIVLHARGKSVVFRTLDMGGDKSAAYLNLPREDNPTLGYRAIRMCLDRPDMFRTQLRAILRASAFGDVRILFPMIVSLEELVAAKEAVRQAKYSLDADNLPYADYIPLGTMIETPAAVLLSDRLAEACDFFSIGSNDLIQYTTASDRGNERVQYLYDNCNLSVLRAIEIVARNANSAGVPWGICGEVASDERLVAMWVALGAANLSVAPQLVGRVKHLIRHCDKSALEAEVQRILAYGNIAQAKAHLGRLLRKIDR